MQCPDIWRCRSNLAVALEERLDKCPGTGETHAGAGTLKMVELWATGQLDKQLGIASD